MTSLVVVSNMQVVVGEFHRFMILCGVPAASISGPPGLGAWRILRKKPLAAADCMGYVLSVIIDGPDWRMVPVRWSLCVSTVRSGHRQGSSMEDWAACCRK